MKADPILVMLHMWHRPFIRRHPLARHAFCHYCDTLISLVHVAITRQYTSQTQLTALEMHVWWCGDKGASAGIMLGRRPVEFVNRLFLLVLAVLLARARALLHHWMQQARSGETWCTLSRLMQMALRP